MASLSPPSRYQRSTISHLARLLVIALVVGLFSVVSPSSSLQQAVAGNGGVCEADGGTAHNGLKVYPSHGEVFYIDTGQGQEVNAAYIGYRVENTSASTKSNLWAKVDNFVGNIVAPANPAGVTYRVGDVASSSSSPAFFLLEANSATATDQAHDLTIYDRDPSLTGAQSLYSCTFTFSEVKETIKAAANKVTGVTNTRVQELGGSVTVVVEGQTGTIGSGTSSPDGEVIWFSPAARSSWPSTSLVLESTQIRFSTNSNFNQNVSTHANTLIFRNPTSTLTGTARRYYYEATYVFRIRGPVSGTVQAIPIAQISSGTQIKHTDISGITADSDSSFTVSTPVNVDVSKNASTSVSGSDGSKEFTYTITLQNDSSNAISLDQIVDDPDAGLSFKASSATYNSVSTGDATANSDGHLIFQGPFAIPANSSRELTYKMVSACTSGSFSYSNYAWGLIGSQVVGSTVSTTSGVSLTGSCPPSSATVTAVSQNLSPLALTQAATSVTATTATINGSINPLGTSGLTVLFEWGTDSSLGTSTTETLSNSTTATAYYSVSDSLSSLSPGTKYYYRVKIGSVYGDILSFTTAQQAADPTVVTDAVTSIVGGTGTDGTATLNGTFDANLVSGGATPYFRWGLADSSGSTNTCTSPTYGSDSPVMEDTDDNGSLDSNVLLTGAFPSSQSLDITGLTLNKYYCAQAVVKWASGGSSAVGSAVVFQVAGNVTVTYSSNSSTSGTAPSNGSGASGSTYTVATNSGTLQRTGWTFSGWNTASNGSGTTYAAGSGTFTLASPTTLFALWKAQVTYNANGGSGAPTDGAYYAASETVTVESNSGMSNTGFVFSEWNTASDGTGTSYDPSDTLTLASSGDLTLFAIWASPVTITYLGNGSTGGSVPNQQSFASGQTATVASNSGSLVRSGFTFGGWQTTSTGGTTYTAGSGTLVISADLTLYARWVSNSGGSSGNGGGGGSSPQTLPTAPGNPGVSPTVRPRPRVPVVPPVATRELPSADTTEESPAPTVASEPSRVPGLPGIRLLTPSAPQNGLGPSSEQSDSPVGGANRAGPFAASTLDLGNDEGQISLDSPAVGSSGGLSTRSIGVRTITEVAQEKLGGFAPGAGTILEILGARTAARFVVTEATLVDSFVLQRAIEESIPAQAANFFSIDRVQPALQPLTPRVWSEDDREGIAEVFAASGLPEPRNLADLDVSPASSWLLVEARSSTYAPGTEVYLTLTSEPIVLATAVVDRNGEATLSGTVPTELLTLGEHRIRLVGIRALDGAFVEEDGSVGITDELLEEIQRFDLGTQSTIAIYGENPEGASHTALRVIPLIPIAPWWTLWLILAAAVVGLATRFIPDRRPRIRRIGSSALVLAAAIPGVILGWLSTVVAVTWWALGLGLVGVLLAALGPYRSSQERSARSGSPDS